MIRLFCIENVLGKVDSKSVDGVGAKTSARRKIVNGVDHDIDVRFLGFIGITFDFPSLSIDLDLIVRICLTERCCAQKSLSCVGSAVCRQSEWTQFTT